MRYAYDAAGRLREVARGENMVRYQYTQRDLVAIDSSRGRTPLRVHYNDTRRVSEITLGDGRSFLFAYVLDERAGTVMETTIQAPDGKISQVAIRDSGQR